MDLMTIRALLDLLSRNLPRNSSSFCNTITAKDRAINFVVKFLAYLHRSILNKH